MVGIMKWILIAIFIFATFGTTDKKTGIFCCNCCQKEKKVEVLDLATEWTCWNCVALNKPSLQKCENEMCKQPKSFLVKNTNDYMEIYKIWTERLSTAVEEGDEERAQLLLNSFPEEKNVKMIDYLMEEHKKGKQIKKKQNKPLHDASQQAYEQIIRLLLDEFNEDEGKKFCYHLDKEKLIDYVDEETYTYYLDKENLKDKTTLYLASQLGYKIIVKLLLKAFEKDKNKQLIDPKETEYQTTALHWASNIGYEDIVKFLLDTKKKEEGKEKLIEYVMKKDENNNTALHLASLQGHEKIVKLLLNVFSNKDSNEKLIEYVMEDGMQKYIALHWASLLGYEKIVTLLLNSFGIKPKNQQLVKIILMKDKNTALYFASLHLLSYNEFNESVILLQNIFGDEKDANEKLIEYVIQEDGMKHTALHSASRLGYQGIVTLLLNAFSKDKNKQLIQYLMKENEMGIRALHLAALEEHVEIVKLLSEKETNVINEIAFNM